MKISCIHIKVTYPDFSSSFLETQTAVNVSLRRHKSFFLQFSGRQSSPEKKEKNMLSKREISKCPINY